MPRRRFKTQLYIPKRQFQGPLTPTGRPSYTSTITARTKTANPRENLKEIRKNKTKNMKKNQTMKSSGNKVVKPK